MESDPTHLANKDADVQDRAEQSVLLSHEVRIRLNAHNRREGEGSLVDC
jgi:hypothetical protein